MSVEITGDPQVVRMIWHSVLEQTPSSPIGGEFGSVVAPTPSNVPALTAQELAEVNAIMLDITKKPLGTLARLDYAKLYALSKKQLEYVIETSSQAISDAYRKIQQIVATTTPGPGQDIRIQAQLDKIHTHLTRLNAAHKQ